MASVYHLPIRASIFSKPDRALPGSQQLQMRPWQAPLYWYPTPDSNGEHTPFERAASTNCASGALLSAFLPSVLSTVWKNALGDLVGAE